jgi:hypothetical protein
MYIRHGFLELVKSPFQITQIVSYGLFPRYFQGDFYLIILERVVPVCPIAEGFVFGSAAAAKGVMLFRFRLVAIGILQLDPPYRVVRSILAELDGRLPIKAVVFFAAQGIAQGTRGAHLDNAYDLVCMSSIGIDPWFNSHAKNRGEIVCTVTGVGANASVIMNGDAPTHIVIYSIRDTSFTFAAVKSNLGMGPIAVRLAAAFSAAA